MYLLWHTHKAGKNKEDVKLLGIFSTKANAKSALGHARRQPGFIDFTDDFEICDYQLDKREWLEGFTTVLGDDLPSWFVKEHLEKRNGVDSKY